VIDFVSPKDGQEIIARGPGITTIPCEGRVLGRNEYGLKIRVTIFTDKWYPQGIAMVRKDGSWRVDPIWLGGAEHIIKAELVDKEGNPIAQKSITVTRIQY
jgi:hypothetical protein